MKRFINIKLAECLLKGDGLDSIEVQNMEYVLEFDEFVRSIKQNMDTTWILGNVTRIPRHELPQTLDFSDFLPLFT